MKLYTDKSGWVRPFESKEDALKYYIECDIKYNSNCIHKIEFAKSIDDIVDVKTPFNPKKCIYDSESYSEYCSELLDQWLSDEKFDKHKRPVNEDEDDDDGCISFFYKNSGIKIIEGAIRRLYKLGSKYYEDIDIYSTMYREY